MRIPLNLQDCGLSALQTGILSLSQKDAFEGFDLDALKSLAETLYETKINAGLSPEQARNEIKTYQVFTKLEIGEYLAVDSYDKTIIKTKVNGEEINEFGKRDRQHYIFDKMPVNGGNSIIIFEPNSIVSITAYVERSEPKWI